MARWIETFKGAVLASEYDAEAYMNSPIYVSRFDQATWFLLHSIGVTPVGMKRRRWRVAIVRQNFQFLKELRGGELVTTRSSFIAVGAKYVRFVHQMLDGVTGRMVAACDCTAVLASLKTGASIALPRRVREEAEAHLRGAAKRADQRPPAGRRSASRKPAR